MKKINTIAQCPTHGRPWAQVKPCSAKAPTRQLLKIIQSLTLAIPGLLLADLAQSAVSCDPVKGGGFGDTNYFCTGPGAADLTLNTNSAALIQNDIVIDGGTAAPNGPTLIRTLTIAGNRSGSYYGMRNMGGAITNLVVTGQLRATSRGLENDGFISQIDNSGLIAVTAASVSAYAIRNTAGATIGSIRNVNGILSSVGGYSIRNEGNLTTLINGQGGNVAALTYNGKLPVNYSIALGSTAASYGQMAATGATASASGPMRFGIDSGAVLSKTYANVLSGVSETLLNSGTLSGTYMGQSWQLLQRGAGIWDLLFPNFAALNVYNVTSRLANSSAFGAARAIDGHANLQALFTGLSGDQAVSNAVSQTLPLLTGGSMVSANAALTGVNGVVQARIEASRGLSSGGDHVSGKHFWIKPFGSWAKQGDVSGVSGYKASTSGLAAGLDDAFSDKTRLGVAFAYANSGVDSNSATAPQRNAVDVYQFIAYGSHSLDETTNLNFQVDAGLNRNNARRTIGFMSSVASANYNSVSTHAGVGLGRAFNLSDKTVLTPSVRADYTWIKDSAYEETGAGLLNLAVGKRSSDQMILAVDGKLSHQLTSGTALTAYAGVGYDALNKQSSITAAFAGAPGASFVTYGLAQDPWIGRVGAGLVQKLKDGVELTARYDAEFRSHFLNQTASLKLRWNF